MNVTQGNFNYKGQVQTDTRKNQPPADLDQFTGQLVAAQTELDWFSNADLKTSPASEAAELFVDKKSKKELEQERVQQDFVFDMVSQRQQQSAKIENQWSEKSAVEQNQGRQMGQEKAQYRFRKGIEELQGRVVDDIQNQKTMEKKGHLFNPALAQSQQDDKGTAQPQKQFTEAAPAAAMAKESEGAKSAFNPQMTDLSRGEAGAMARRGGQHQQFDQNRQDTGAQGNKAQVAKLNQAQGAQSAFAKAAAARAEMLSGKVAQKSSAADLPGLNLSGLKGEPSAQRADAKAQAQATQPRYTEKLETKEMGQQIKMSLNAKRTEMTMQLRPEHLGRVQIKLTKDGEIYRGKMEVESTAAKEALERSLPELTKSLEAQGVKVESFTISLRDEQAGAQGFADNSGQQPNQQGEQQGTQNALKLEERRGFDPRMSVESPEPGPAKRASESDVSIYA
ncbi:MAG: flagellar hook-length control protein FliK [bacterium]|nr:flagellar hook-length control protein FliK [bacterium]